MKTKLINKKACRDYLLDLSKIRRNGKFTRVAENVFGYLNSRLRMEMDSLLYHHPSIGKTICVETKSEKGKEETA